MFVKINDSNNLIKAIKKNNILTYNENNEKIIITDLKNKLIIIKQTKDHEIKMGLANQKDIVIEYYDISLDITLNIEAYCNKLYKDEHLIIIEYYIKENNEKFSLKIEMSD